MLKKLFGSEDDGKLQPGDEELIGTSIFGDDDFENVPDWIQKQIHKIRSKGLGDSPEELTHELVGKTFIYRLDFDGPSGEILGVYRRLKDKAKKQHTKKVKLSQPPWKEIGQTHKSEIFDVVHYGHSPYTVGPIPKWLFRRVGNHSKYPLKFDVFYYANGKRYKYRWVWAHQGQGTEFVIVWRKPRTWYWKTLNG